MSYEVSLAQQQVSPHGLQVFQQQVVAVEDIQQVFASVEVRYVDLLLESPLQVGQQLCGYKGAQIRMNTSEFCFWTQINLYLLGLDQCYISGYW